MYFIAILLSACLGKQIHPTEGAIYHNHNMESVKIDIQPQQHKQVKKYPNQETTIWLDVVSLNQGIHDYQGSCYSIDKDIEFDDYANRIQNVIEKPAVVTVNQQNNIASSLKLSDARSANVEDPSYYLTNPILVNMVHTTGGFIMVTSNHVLYQYDIVERNGNSTNYEMQKKNSFSFNYLRPNASENEVPQLVHDPHKDFVYIIYKLQVILVQNNNKTDITFKNISLQGGLSNDNQYLGNVKAAHGYLFVPLGSDGLDIYKIQFNGDLQYIRNYGANDIYQKPFKILIVDTAIGGPFGKHLYILDKQRGVTNWRLQFIADSITLDSNADFGLIPIIGGTVLKEYRAEVLIVMVEQQYIYNLTYQKFSIAANQAVEIGLVWSSKEWFIMQTHNLDGHYFDIDITRNFAILRGVDAHRIIQHSIWEGFQPLGNFWNRDNWMNEETHHQDESYLILPRLQSLSFYSPQYGVGDPQFWHINNKTSPFVVGMTSHDVAMVPWVQIDPYVECFIRDGALVGQTLKYQIHFNSTWCQEKSEALVKIFLFKEMIFFNKKR